MYNKQTLVCEDKVGKRGYRITQTVTVEKLLYPEKYPELKPPGTSGAWLLQVHSDGKVTDLCSDGKAMFTWINIKHSTSPATYVSSIKPFICWLFINYRHSEPFVRINWWQISTFLMLSRMDHISKRRALHYFNSFHLGHLTRDLARPTGNASHGFS